MLIVKIVFLFLTVWLTLINVARIYYKADIPSINFLGWAIGICGLIIMQFML